MHVQGFMAVVFEFSNSEFAPGLKLVPSRIILHVSYKPFEDPSGKTYIAKKVEHITGKKDYEMGSTGTRT